MKKILLALFALGMGAQCMAQAGVAPKGAVQSSDAGMVKKKKTYALDSYISHGLRQMVEGSFALSTLFSTLESL